LSVTSGQRARISRFDLWFDASAKPPGQNYGAEPMIWTNHRGRPQPIGSRVATVGLEGGTWDVWIGNIGWNVISYVRTTPANTMNDFSVRAMTSVQAGFEPWIGGAGLAVDRFAFNLNGGTGGQSTVIRGAASNRCLDLAGWGTGDGTANGSWPGPRRPCCSSPHTSRRERRRISPALGSAGCCQEPLDGVGEVRDRAAAVVVGVDGVVTAPRQLREQRGLPRA
jgi:hypothetical protein